ncbi:glycosyltransferase family 4 protein [Aliterella atlantica]|nr:glycosyltransferase family 1 protein [Aliterella atlantica]
MPEFSMDVYAEGLVSGLRAIRPEWEIVELFPQPIDRKSRSSLVRVRKYYERFWNFPRHVTQQDTDIVHIVEAAEAHMVYWLRKTAKRTVVTCHDLINYFYSDNRVASVQLPMVSHQMWLHAIQGMRYADRVVAVSAATAKDTVQILNLEPDRIRVVPNAVEAVFQPLPDRVQSIRQQYALQPNTFCLLNVGSDHRRKNLLNILQSLAILNQVGLSFVFWKVGSDFTAEQKDLIQHLQLEQVVRYLGKPDRATLVDFYNAADVLVSPSLFEGFGMTLLEAMACGTPAITSNVSSMPEVVGDSGLLVDPNSVQAIADAVLRLYKDRTLYTDLVNKGFARVKPFTWQNTAEQVATIYEKLLQPG